VEKFGRQTLMLFKLMLIEKKICFYSTSPGADGLSLLADKLPVHEVSKTILSMVSLVPGLLEQNALGPLSLTSSQVFVF
jgi:hypothetical protein